MYLLFVCTIRLESKMQGERFNQGGDVALFGGSEFSSRGAVFYRKPRSQGDFILPRGQHFKGGDAIL